MQVRLGTRCGINLVYIAHWAFAEVEVEPPPPPPPADAPLVQTLPAEEPNGESTTSTSVPPPSSAPPAPVPVAAVQPLSLPDCTLTLYMNAAEATPLVLYNEDARAVLGVLVAQSGSLT